MGIFRNVTYRVVVIIGLMLGWDGLHAAELPDFAELVEDNGPTIVEISITRTLAARPAVTDRELEELLRRLNPGQEEFDLDQIPEQRQSAGVGSGFIISSDGYVVTNNHVVLGADEIHVHLSDRRMYDAEIVGLDEPSDIALLKIDATELPHVTFGDSDALRVGEWVLAIGSPFGLEFSAAAGIVSAMGRSMPNNSTYNYMSFIQTDVAINQGNSGGPLFNLNGEVIGINSQILSSTGGSNGISFSIPSNVALNVVNQLQETGRVERGLLGVRMQEVDYALAEIFGMERPRGAFVDEVQDNSPAAIAGIEDEDIILQFNGHPIEFFTDLPFYVGQYKPGTTAEVMLYRNAEVVELLVTLGSSPTNEFARVEEPVVRERRNPLGFRVGEVSEDARQTAGLAGVRIAELDEGPGLDAGLLVGDIIVSLNRQAISSTEDFAAVADQLPENGFIPIRIVRDGQGTTVALELKP